MLENTVREFWLILLLSLFLIEFSNYVSFNLLQNALLAGGQGVHLKNSASLDVKTTS